MPRGGMYAGDHGGMGPAVVGDSKQVTDLVATLMLLLWLHSEPSLRAAHSGHRDSLFAAFFRRVDDA